MQKYRFLIFTKFDLGPFYGGQMASKPLLCRYHFWAQPFNVVISTPHTTLQQMALKIIDHGTNEYRQMIDLRNAILRKPLGLTFTPEELDSEKDNLLMAAYEDGQMLGCCMLVKEDGETVRLRQMAVLNDLQGKGIGKALMTFAENLARDRGYKKITMHARKNALGFYEKMGYKQKGEEFQEITIPHYVMEKAL